MGFNLLYAFAIGLGATAALIGSVFLSGATFGQRCEKVYSDAQAIERCIDRLNSGGKVYTS